MAPPVSEIVAVMVIVLSRINGYYFERGEMMLEYCYVLVQFAPLA
jgi:hypothetical protein